MSVVIDNTEDLMTLLKKLGLKVNSVDELRQLLATINANYNPDAARARTGKLIGVSVPSVMAGSAGFVSFCLFATTGHELTPFHVAAVASIWGVCGLVSVAALIGSFILAGGRRAARTLPDSPPDQQASSDPLVTAITDRLR